MKHSLIILALIGMGAQAQGFQDEPTCYSWSGGHKSSGSFSKCGAELQAAKPKPTPPRPEPVVTQVIQPPTIIQQTVVCPAPEPKPHVVKPKPRPKPKATC